MKFSVLTQSNEIIPFNTFGGAWYYAKHNGGLLVNSSTGLSKLF